jgi:hypothetical protein
MQNILITSIKPYIEPWLLFLVEDPLLRSLQFSLIGAGALAVFLVFYTTRDILLRTNSFLYMFFCILLVAVLPGVGFLLYILIRPPRTIKERELEKMIGEILKQNNKKPAKKKREVKV